MTIQKTLTAVCISSILSWAAPALADLPTPSPVESTLQLKTLSGYRPDTLPSVDAAKAAFKSLPADVFKGKSGCFQRAHVWSTFLDKKQNFHSMKVFLYFTRRYQREFNYEWFYHVAPLAFVQTEAGPQEYVLDPSFTKTAVPLAEWTQHFIYPGQDCKVVDNYTDYSENQDRYYCYLMKAPMYTYIPRNIELEPAVRTQWNKLDIENMKRSYNLLAKISLFEE